MGKGYLVITKKGGRYFTNYSPKAKGQFYAHVEPTYARAVQSAAYFKRKGVYAKVMKNFLR